jgi:hypothetical protein
MEKLVLYLETVVPTLFHEIFLLHYISKSVKTLFKFLLLLLFCGGQTQGGMQVAPKIHPIRQNQELISSLFLILYKISVILTSCGIPSMLRLWYPMA